MAEHVKWSEDICTCSHGVSYHEKGDGRCAACDHTASWDHSNEKTKYCLRFQWNEEPRKRVW